MSLTVGVISDTHGVLHSEVFDHFDGVKAIFHCGDVCDPNILTDLESIAPVYAVSGNMDPFPISTTLPEQRSVEVEGRRFGLVHGHLIPYPPERHVDHILKALGDPPPEVVMFGHTHVWHWEKHGPVWVLNPGSAAQPRQGKAPTICRLTHNAERDKWTARKINLNGRK